jgi:hypothetical protein
VVVYWPRMGSAPSDVRSLGPLKCAQTGGASGYSMLTRGPTGPIQEPDEGGDVRVVLHSRSLEDSLNLGQWLGAEPEIRPNLRRVTRPPADGEMGSVADVLQVAVATGGTATVLAAALKSWLEQPRRSSIRIVVEYAGGNPRSVEIEADRVRAGEIGDLFQRAFSAEAESRSS